MWKFPAKPRRQRPARGLEAPAALALWHLSSLDAPTVAVVWALGFAWAAGISLPLWVPALLALVAWAVYIGDRLLDARSAIGSGQLHLLRQRHLFHWRHRRFFLPLAAAIACAAFWIVLTSMPIVTRERDTVLAAAALAYFARVHGKGYWQSASTPIAADRPGLPSRFAGASLAVRGFPWKEMLVGILFTAACVLPAWSRVSSPQPLLFPAVYFALLAWLNCHLIESWESGSEAPNSLPLIHAMLGFLLAAFLAHGQPRIAQLVAAGAAGALLLALLHRFRSRLAPLSLRAAADLVLLTPLALLLR